MCPTSCVRLRVSDDEGATTSWRGRIAMRSYVNRAISHSIRSLHDYLIGANARFVVG